MDEQSAPAAPVVKKTSRVCDKVVPESGSGFGVICIVVGSIIAASQ